LGAEPMMTFYPQNLESCSDRVILSAAKNPYLVLLGFFAALRMTRPGSLRLRFWLVNFIIGLAST